MRLPTHLAASSGSAPAVTGEVSRPSAPEHDPGVRFDPRQYLAIVLAHWWVLLLCLVAGSVAGLGYCLFTIPVYRASCRFEVYQESALKLGDVLTTDALSRNLSRHVVIMRSEGLKLRVLDQLATKWAHLIPPERREPALTVKPVPESPGTMVDIAVDAESGEYALEYLSALIDGYKEMRQSESMQANENAVRNLRAEYERLAEDLKLAQDALVQYQQEHSIRLNETREQLDDVFLARLLQRQDAVRMERVILETHFPFLQNADTATIQDVLALTMETHAATSVTAAASVTPGGPSETTGKGPPGGLLVMPTSDRPVPQWPERLGWQQQEALLAGLEADLAEKLKTYKPGHPKMVELSRQVEGARRDLQQKAEIALKGLRARHQALKLQEAALDQAASSWKQELKLSTGERAQYAKLKAQAERLRGLQDQVFARIVDNTAKTVDMHFTRIVEPPRIWKEAIWPNRLKVMASALIAAIGLGIGLAFALDYLDTGLLDIVAIEERLGLRYLSGIPRWNRVIPQFSSRKLQTVMTKEKASAATEAYRSLRASVEQAIGEHGPYALLVTSGDASEGKSFTCLNLAVAYAWTGKRVLLVDGDLRRASLHRAFGIKNERGLIDLLMATEADWHALVQRTEHETLAILPAGRYHHGVPELVDPARMSQFVKAWREEYDMVLVDSAPVGRVVDTMTLAKVCDGVLMVALYGRTGFSDVRHSLRRLAGAKMLGLCLNAIDVPRHSRGGSYAYGYYGRYRPYYYYYRSYYGYGDKYGPRSEAARESTPAPDGRPDAT